MTVEESAIVFDVFKWGAPVVVVITGWLARAEFVGRVNKEAIRLANEDRAKAIADIHAANKELRDEVYAQRERTTRMEVQMENIYLWMADIKAFIKGKSNE